MFHDARNLVGSQAVACRVVGRCDEQHTWVQSAGVFDHFIYIVGKGVFQFVQGIHVGFAAAFAGDSIVVPPREFWNQDGTVVAFCKIVMHDVLQDVLATIAQQHLFLGYSVDLAQTHRHDALLSLVVDAGIETQILRVEVSDGIYHLLRRLEVEFVTV